jgi:hypothetical protein
MGGYRCISDCLNESAGDGRSVESLGDLHLKVIGKRGVEAAGLGERLCLEIGEWCDGGCRSLNLRNYTAINGGCKLGPCVVGRHVEIEDRVDGISGLGTGEEAI